MSRLQDQIAANLNTDAITDILSEIANDAAGITFVSLPAQSQTFFTAQALRDELEGEEIEDATEEEIRQLEEDIAAIETKGPQDCLIQVLDNNGEIHKFVL